MRLAFVSDTHFGDNMCTLVNHKTFQPGIKFDAFSDAAGVGNDFLVMLGDIFDFSIAPYDQVYPHARAFFKLVRDNGIAKNIIYVPGNHDFDMWQTVQQQIRVIYQLRQGQSAKQARWSVPGLIDDRARSNTRGFSMPGVIDEPVSPNKRPSGEKLFLNCITRDPGDGPGKDTNFYVAYPNLYMVTDEHSVIATHGHYLETFWTLSGEWIKKVFKLQGANAVEDLVALNIPLCQLACSGIGQAGKLTTVIHKIQRQAKDGDLTDIKKYIDNLDNALDELTEAKWYNPKSWAEEVGTDALSNLVKKKVKKALENRDETRFSKKFADDDEVRERFKTYYRASWNEIKGFNLGIPQPEKVIFGHTHRPIEWLAKKAPEAKVVGGKKVRLYNTGGWLLKKNKKGKKEFCGAEVFKYESGVGFSSVSVA